ncbi:MAG TPA: hypothetical protein VGO46_05095 [Gemmatimonadaceae bacterium]|jgi:hypothetical protein|nr:hypothetical protein [Gemmatimonadaceae bacterium]
MQLKWIATAAFAVALIPAAASAQSKTPKDTSASNNSAKHDTVTSASSGEISSTGSDVSAAVEKARKDPNLIGSPAWWALHATADGKPLSAQAKHD